MPLFGTRTRRHRARDRAYVTEERRPRSGWARFYPRTRRDPDRVAGGYRTYFYAPSPPLDRCQALCPSSKKLNTHTPSPQALRSLIPTLRVKVDVMPSGSYAAWYARLFVVVVLLPRS